MTKRFLQRVATYRPALALLAACGLAGAAETDRPADEELTFFVVSDTHYGMLPVHDATNRQVVDKMNALPGTPFPDALGGKVGTPRGVLHCGDVTNSSTAEHWDAFVKDYGLDGTDWRLKYPVYETFGNHDGGSRSPVLEGIRQRNASRVGVKDVSENGLYYAWDWGRVRFVCLGISPGTTRIRHDPANSIDFAVRDLAKSVGTSGRPVFLFHHFGPGVPGAGQTRYRDAIKGYQVAGILHGHDHRPFITTWQGFDVYHPPHQSGFFVFRLAGGELSVAERKMDDTWGLTSKKPVKLSDAGGALEEIAAGKVLTALSGTAPWTGPGSTWR